MSKVNLNKISVKQPGGQMIPQQPGMRNQTQQVDPRVQQVTEMISMSVNDGKDIVDVILELTQQQVDQQLIAQALMMGGMQQEDVQTVFEQVAVKAEPPGPSNPSEVNANPQLLARNEELESQPVDLLEGMETDPFAKSGIEIKKENRGKFTKWAKARGMGVQEAARKVLANKDNYPPSVVKMANFARNAASWKKEEGGEQEEFKPHFMYKGERKIKANDVATHLRLKDAGYGHEPPKAQGGGSMDYTEQMRLKEGSYNKGREHILDPRFRQFGGSGEQMESGLSNLAAGTYAAYKAAEPYMTVQDDDAQWQKYLKNTLNPVYTLDNLLQLSSIPANLIRESIEGIGGKGDGKFNAGDILPDVYNTTIMDENPNNKLVSETLDIDNFLGATATDMALDPLSYVGVGVLRNLSKTAIAKLGKKFPQLLKYLEKIPSPAAGVVKREGGDIRTPSFLEWYQGGGGTDVSQNFIDKDTTTSGGGINLSDWNQRALLAGSTSNNILSDAIFTGADIYNELFSGERGVSGLQKGAFRGWDEKAKYNKMIAPLYYDYDVNVDTSDENVNALAAYYKKVGENTIAETEANQAAADAEIAATYEGMDLDGIDLASVLSGRPVVTAKTKQESINPLDKDGDGIPDMVDIDGGDGSGIAPKQYGGSNFNPYDPDFDIADYIQQFSQTDYMRDTQNVADSQLQQKFPNLGSTPQQVQDQEFLNNLATQAVNQNIDNEEEVVVEPTVDELWDAVIKPEVNVSNKLEGTVNRVMDSNLMRGFSSLSDSAVKAAGFANRLYDQKEADKALEDRADALMADNLFATVTSDAGDKGNWKTNLGSLRSTKDRITGYDEFFQQPNLRFAQRGLEIEVDQNLLTELIAAGADIEIL